MNDLGLTQQKVAERLGTTIYRKYAKIAKFTQRYFESSQRRCVI